MTRQTFRATASSAYGKPLPKSVGDNGTLKLSGEYDAFDTLAEVQAEYSKPGAFEKFVVESANAAAKANAIATERNAQLKALGIEPPKMEDDRELQIKSIMRGLTASGKSEAEARQIAETLV